MLTWCKRERVLRSSDEFNQKLLIADATPESSMNPIILLIDPLRVMIHVGSCFSIFARLFRSCFGCVVLERKQRHTIHTPVIRVGALNKRARQQCLWSLHIPETLCHMGSLLFGDFSPNSKPSECQH